MVNFDYDIMIIVGFEIYEFMFLKFKNYVVFK